MKLKLQSLENKGFEFEFSCFPSVAFENGSNVRLTDDGPTSSLQRSRKIVPLPSRCLFPRLAPPSDRWCDVLRFVPAGNVSSSSTLQIFRKANHYTPSIAFRHLPPRKDVVNQCLDFGKSPVKAALPASRSVRSFPFTPACPERLRPSEFVKVDVEHWDVSACHWVSVKRRVKSTLAVSFPLGFCCCCCCWFG